VELKTTDAQSAPMTEEGWWDQYGQINEEIWQYNEYLFALIRRPYLQRMFQFLYKPAGRLLDFGCGNGWVSLPFANSGMSVVGIDLSSAQVQRATRRAATAGLDNAHYYQGDLESIPQDGSVDSVVVHSLLHHLPDEHKRKLLGFISMSLAPKGRIFLYEPIAVDPRRPWYGALLDKGILGLFRTGEYLGLRLKLFKPAYATLRRSGWQMISPSEAPILYTDLLALVPADLQLVESHYWHAYSLKYANLCMSLKPLWQRRFQRLTPLLCWLDHRILNSHLRNATKAWPMATIALEKV
jgi:2-polyprenyl-3-methyl-5-hydroxy-6-metoxy-1,4-benzoquinol methylase